MKLNIFLIISGLIIIFLSIRLVFLFAEENPKQIPQKASFDFNFEKCCPEPKEFISLDYKFKSSRQKSDYPKEVKGIYLTAYMAANDKIISNVIQKAKSGRINAVVIDVKDYKGYITYNSELEVVQRYNTSNIVIKDIKELVGSLRKNGLYVIARLPVFQDYALAIARPDLSLYDSKLSDIYYSDQKNSLFTMWGDTKGLFWLDPSSIEVWNYNVLIAYELYDIGFDEVNFDYIRLPSDGDIKRAEFPLWDYDKSRREIIKSFFNYLNKNLRDKINISADIFGMTTTERNDLGIGQVIEDAFENFDFVCPMVYPSHYSNGFLGYQNPADYPYEIVKYSMNEAFNRLENYGGKSKIRPWLQDFDFGAEYNKEMVNLQIKAVLDSSKNRENLYNGWMLWDPSGFYNI